MEQNIDLRETIEYKMFGYSVIKCPVCGNDTLDTYFICPHCKWEYDGIIDDNSPSSTNGKLTIKEYRTKLDIE